MFSTLFLVCFPLSPVLLNFKAHSASEYDRTSHSPLKASANDQIVLQIKRKASMCTLITRSGRLRLMASLQSHVGRNLRSLEQATVLKVRSFVCSSSFRRKNVRDINWYGKRSIFLFLEI